MKSLSKWSGNIQNTELCQYVSLGHALHVFKNTETADLKDTGAQDRSVYYDALNQKSSILFYWQHFYRLTEFQLKPIFFIVSGTKTQHRCVYLHLQIYIESFDLLKNMDRIHLSFSHQTYQHSSGLHSMRLKANDKR